MGNRPRWTKSRLAAPSPGWGAPPVHLEMVGGRAVPSPKRPGEPGDSDTLGGATHVFLVKRPFGDGTVPSHLLRGLSERV